jgi:hypothetical protein
VAEYPSYQKYGNTRATGSLKKGGNTLKGENTYKFVKMIEKTATGESSAQALDSLSNPINVLTGKYQGRRYYVIDTKAINILLKAEAITQVRSDLGISKEASKSYLIPAELGLEIDGIGGIKPGNICHTDYIQRIYNERTTGDKGPNTFFQIFDITQKVSDDGWTTTLGTKMRLNGNALSGDLTGSFDGVLDMKFGTPVKKRQKAKTQAEVHAAIDLYNAESAELMAEARAASLSDAELSRPDDAEMEGDLKLDEIELDDFSNLDKPPPPPEIPVITAATGNLMEFEGSPIQNNILYKARPDLRSKNDAGGWIVASFDERKKAWNKLHERDEPESQAAIVAEAARVEAAQIAVDDKKVITDAEAQKLKDDANKAAAAAKLTTDIAAYNKRLTEEASKINFEYTDVVEYTDGYGGGVTATYSGDIGISGGNVYTKDDVRHKEFGTSSAGRGYVQARLKATTLFHFATSFRTAIIAELGGSEFSYGAGQIKHNYQTPEGLVGVV